MFTQVRAPTTSADLALSEEARKLFESLGLTVRPIETARRFPRIVNHMAAIWKKPLLMDNYFMDLMLDQRGNRMGFPLPVATEIAALQEYYSRVVYPKTSHNVWEKTQF